MDKKTKPSDFIQKELKKDKRWLDDSLNLYDNNEISQTTLKINILNRLEILYGDIDKRLKELKKQIKGDDKNG